ncbi:isocitrate/isopropylmalate family dehydrogenase [Cognatiyoonia sp. IB215182]|uniref:isocitrate/isopropylmalate family dehydrogenase n=1 Tax=Cognatiyoonia sp. IB215182 TaxID=3097353 RepID=UPI002A0E8D67|nr:isocitrate/isopropylmalate family dehydrogenase [Cognatiyoonia sp. IB215182]MDX8354730.1 isocitrate/isopropylmalate family dehydrogenase [Cognatiyoonia sp. IB215182]
MGQQQRAWPDAAPYASAARLLRRPSPTVSFTRCRIGTDASRPPSSATPNTLTDQFHVDILTARFVTNLDWFDVVVGPNLFGHILSDLGPAVAGSIGIAPTASLDPTGRSPS